MEINCRMLFANFDAPSTFLLSCLLATSVLFSLRLDGTLPVHWGVVFAPLWFLTGMVFLGAIVGVFSFSAHPPSSSDLASRIDFVSMLLTSLQYCLLASFEALLYYRLELASESDSEPGWVVVFLPLLAESLLALIISIWAIRHDRTFEFELFFAINMVQFVFIAFKLEGLASWAWTIVLVPWWVLSALAIVGLIYVIAVTAAVTRANISASRRRAHLCAAAAHIVLVASLAAFLILLTKRLDALPDEWAAAWPMYIVFTPLHFALAWQLTLAACWRGNSSSNSGAAVWWFGLRQPACHALLIACPPLQTFANISYRFGGDAEPEGADVEDGLVHSAVPSSAEALKPIAPVDTIEIPD